MGSNSLFASNFWHNRDRSLWMVPMYFFFLAETHRLICNTTYLAQHVTSYELDLRSNSENGLVRSIWTYFDASWREKHDAAKIISLAFSVQKLFAKKRFCKKALFWPFLTSVALPDEIRSMLIACERKSCKRAIDCFFFRRLPAYGRFWDMGAFPEKMQSAKFDFWWPLLTSIATWPKNDLNTFEWLIESNLTLFPLPSYPS